MKILYLYKKLLWSVFFWIQILPIKSDNNCRIDKVEIPLFLSRIILTFECYSGNDYNPTIPIDNGSNQKEYNELDLSPNMFTEIPTEQVCQFVNIYLLDLSHNRIRNLSSAFVNLKCLRSLKKFDLSSNLIVSPLTGNDFDQDANFTSHLEYFSLKYNNIPSIESKVFFKSDGTSKFPNLAFLDLSYNQLKSLDLVWPMSLQHPSLQVMLHYNKITNFKNELNFSTHNRNLLAVTGRRKVDIRHNLLSRFDDTNLLQYGLHTAQDFQNFLGKLSNFDLRSNKLFCLCHEGKQPLTVTWFEEISQLVKNQDDVIYQLLCANLPGYSIFNFKCPFFKINNSTMSIPQSKFTRPSTKTMEATTQSNNLSNNTEKFKNTDLKPIGPLKMLTNTIPFKKTTSNVNLWWFLFFLVPIFLLVLVLFCNFRVILITCYQYFGINICVFLRRIELENAYTSSKIYDASICYSLYDQNWFEENFLPTFCDYIRGYKINKLGLNYSKSNSDSINPTHIECLRSSKRIILLLTEKFMKNVWTNANFQDVLRNMCKLDKNCVILLISISKTEELKSQMNSFKKEVNMQITTHRHFHHLKRKLKSNFSLNQIEMLEWDNLKFWSKLLYLLPLIEGNLKSHSSLSQYSKRQIESPLSIIVDSTHDNQFAETDLQLIDKLNTSLKQKIIKNNESNRAVQEKPSMVSGFIEKDGFWTRSETNQNVIACTDNFIKNGKYTNFKGSFLEDLLDNNASQSSQSSTSGNSVNKSKNLWSQMNASVEPDQNMSTVDVSIVNSDLFLVNETLPPNPTKRRRRNRNKKRLKKKT